MRLFRTIASLVLSMLLSGMACMPVHADRPVGDVPVALSPEFEEILSGTWCMPSDKLDAEEWCWSVKVLDPVGGRLSVKRLSEERRATEWTTLHIRGAAKGPEEFAFLSEEDAVLKGTYLWALARPTAATVMLVWFTHQKRDAFAELVRQGLLPGRITEKTEGRSEIWGMPMDQTVILENLNEEHLKLIIDRRNELFDPFSPFVLVRPGSRQPVSPDAAKSN